MKNLNQFQISTAQLRTIYGGSNPERPKAKAIDTSGLIQPIQPVEPEFDTELAD